MYNKEYVEEHRYGLRSANLTGIELENTNLERATLRNAILKDANLKGANLTGCRINEMAGEGSLCTVAL